MQMHHFSTFYDVFSSAKLQWPHYLPFLQTMCRAIEVYHLDEAICYSVQNSDGIKTRILLMSAFLTGIPTEKKVEDCHFSIFGQNFGTKNNRHQKSFRTSSAIQVGKNSRLCQLFIKQHMLFCLVRKKRSRYVCKSY